MIAEAVKTAKPLWHSTPAAQVLVLTRTGEQGLTAADAASRLVRDGPNELTLSKRTSLPRLFLRQFNSPLIYLLVVAAGVSLSLEHFVDAAFIGVVLLLNSLIGTVQEQKAAASLDALRQMIGLSAAVRRDGAVAVVDAKDIVVGDLVEVESGMAVPAAGRENQ
jgi:Ca2+-transporting ATPase